VILEKRTYDVVKTEEDFLKFFEDLKKLLEEKKKLKFAINNNNRKMLDEVMFNLF
jgi:hypothetical protein